MNEYMRYKFTNETKRHRDSGLATGLIVWTRVAFGGKGFPGTLHESNMHVFVQVMQFLDSWTPSSTQLYS